MTEQTEKFKKPTRASVTREAIRDGLTNEEVVAKLDEVFGPGAGKLNCVRWYRHQDPQITGRARTTSIKKAEIHTAFREALNAMEDSKRAEVVLSLVQKHFDTFVQKVPIEELKSYIPEELLPKAPVKAEKPAATEGEAPKAPKGKKAKEESVAATAPDVSEADAAPLA